MSEQEEDSGSCLPQLPAELQRKSKQSYFFISCLEANPTSSTSLLSINQAAYQWLKPFIYHSISFTTARKLVLFHRTHDVPDDRLSSRLGWVHNLYIGAGPEQQGDLLYTSPWPLTIVCRLFWVFTSLERLALLHLDQNQWQKLEYAIPSSLKVLTLGPIHGPFHVSDLRKKPQLEHFTSAEAFMRDDEVLDVVTYPSMKTFRRMTNSTKNGVALCCTDQVECVAGSQNLERYEITICAPEPEADEGTEDLRTRVKEITDDPRVYISTVPGSQWNDVIYDEYCSARRQFFGEQQFP
ncbi:hypothetical protein DFP72DRAFT_1077536 [Ephemerocybe angulata]|uniref:Uncharacterized protein n=1 Tax=Ephemerocybe angulata TaxID=980116 RepID=A0A8H6LY39_9AGAR|nr:hypothetical protein DFP72DRAFT_1077536 [Tulosesus angulatus]